MSKANFKRPVNKGKFKGGNKFRRKESSNKAKAKVKVHMSFDSDARLNYLTGFQKRKQERKAHYKAKLDKELKEEKQKLRAKVKSSIGKKSSSNAILPEVEELLKQTKTYDVGNATVSITSLDDRLQPNLPPLLDSENESDEAEVPENEDESRNQMVNKEVSRLLRQSKAFKASEKMKQKKRKKRKRKQGHDKSDTTRGPAITKRKGKKTKGGKK